MTELQKEQWNLMRDTLIKIGKEYMTSEQIMKKDEKVWGLSAEDITQMAYDNIQKDARVAVKGIKAMKK